MSEDYEPYEIYKPVLTRRTPEQEAALRKKITIGVLTGVVLLILSIILI